MKSITVEELHQGDMIAIKWIDAWQAQRLPHLEKGFDAPWAEWGAFLFIRGEQERNLIIAYAKPPGGPHEWVITAVPLSIIKTIMLVYPKFLQEFCPLELKRLQSSIKKKRKARKRVLSPVELAILATRFDLNGSLNKISRGFRS